MPWISPSTSLTASEGVKVSAGLVMVEEGKKESCAEAP